VGGFMEKRVMSSEEFINRFVECLEKGEDFELYNCVVEGNVDILDIYMKIKEKIKDKEKLKELITEDEKDENILKWIIKNINVDINIYISNVKFNNDFRLYNENKQPIFEIGKAERLQMVFNGNVDFIKSEFNGETIFENSIFNKEVNYFECTFKRADFSNVLFNGYVSFYNSEFHRDVNFMQTKFFGYVNFHATKFNEFVGFIFSEFNGVISFSHSEFNRVKFLRSIFVGEITFIDSIFKETDFTGSKFNGKVNFSNIAVNKIYFRNSTFKSIAEFSDISFNLLIFTKTIFEDIAFFRKKNPNNGIAIFNLVNFKNPDNTTFIDFPLSKTSFLLTDVKDITIIAKAEKILSEYLLDYLDEINNRVINENNKNELYEMVIRILKPYLRPETVLKEYRDIRKSFEKNRTYVEASELFIYEMALLKKGFDKEIEQIKQNSRIVKKLDNLLSKLIKFVDLILDKIKQYLINDEIKKTT